MKTTAAIQMDHLWIEVDLDAVELAENRLTCDIPPRSGIRTSAGEEYTFETTRILCLEGVAFARRTLRVPNGLAVVVYELRGVVDRTEENGISLAIAVAIARALNESSSSLLEIMSGWHLID